jgi:hypothetical protein
MNEQQIKLLIEILNSIVESAYRQMGEEWCKDMWNMIDKLKHSGKS